MWANNSRVHNTDSFGLPEPRLPCLVMDCNRRFFNRAGRSSHVRSHHPGFLQEPKNSDPQVTTPAPGSLSHNPPPLPSSSNDDNDRPPLPSPSLSNDDNDRPPLPSPSSSNDDNDRPPLRSSHHAASGSMNTVWPYSPNRAGYDDEVSHGDSDVDMVLDPIWNVNSLSHGDGGEYYKYILVPYKTRLNIG
jgi:hypothetical protein